MLGLMRLIKLNIFERIKLIYVLSLKVNCSSSMSPSGLFSFSFSCRRPAPQFI